MGEQGRCTGLPSELLMNGLLSNESSLLFSDIHPERWSRVEDRTAELIACIQPNQPSEERRNAVADYVQRLIMKCFPCQVFTFGSVPLKTYLPDGDIDLTAFSNNPNLKDTWATLVRDILKSEEKNADAEFRVKEVQYIEAEVKLIKCLVENIVVDISFDQLGGLCTLCFLEEIDHLINQNHLFKRSIILIKAWCYYESRILGAHHGLISTYALETLVLYIFHVFNNSFAGPLEVLYRFLEFFSHFDWDNFCLSLWGPVPISSLPDVTPEPPRKDSGELLLTRGFLEKCNAAYAVLPTGQENQGQPFLIKHFNVIDPLRVNNNLGRSVSKGNFFRIRSAFAFGAKRLARLLSCSKEEIVLELNQFFMNTWERHGSGIRPDAPACDFRHLMPSYISQSQALNNYTSVSSSKKNNQRPSAHESLVEVINSSYNHSIQHSNYPSESTSTKNGTASVYRAQTQKEYANQSNSRMSDRSEKGDSNQGTQVDRSQRNSKLENNVNEYNIQGKYLIVRTRSSPALSDSYTDTSSQSRHHKAADSAENHVASRRMNGRSDSVSTHSTVSSSDEPPGRNIATHQNVDVSTDASSLSNHYAEDSGHGNVSEERASVFGAQGMLQEEQDLVNMMSFSGNNFGGQFPMHLNFPSSHLPYPFSPSLVASIGYAQRNLAGLMPGNIPLVDPSWASNLQFAQGLIPSPLPQYFPGLGLSSNSNENHDSAEISPADAYSESVKTEDRQPSTSGSTGFVQSARHSGSSRHQSRYTKENRGSMGNEHHDNSPHLDSRTNDVFPDDRVGSWDGSSAKGSKITRDKRGKKSAASATSSSVYGKGKRVSEYASVDVEDDSRDGNEVNLGTELAERNSALYLPNRLGHESAQTSASESFGPAGQVILGPASRQQGADGSGGPFTFYPTGPPVPFVTMLPFYNVPSDARSSGALPNHLGKDEGLNIGQVFESCDGFDSSNSAASKDILNGDFLSHWQNLQFGRSCQNPRFIYPSPVVVPPGYLQGRSPWDGPGRPLGMNMNMFSQIMNYRPRLVPISPVQPASDTPVGSYQRFVKDMPRYRTGTGTYLPNPKASRDRQSSGARRSNYHYDRNDQRGEREGNWNASKSRAASRNHIRNQADKPSSRIDRLSLIENRVERPWSSHSHDSLPPYPSQNGPLHPSSSQGSSATVAYGMHPLQGMNPGSVGSNGPIVPSVVMFYPYDSNSSYGGSSGEPLEFGSVGPMGFIGSNEVSHVMEGVRARGAVEEQRFHGSSQISSPDQPSSPHFQRRT